MITLTAVGQNLAEGTHLSSVQSLLNKMGARGSRLNLA